MGEKLYQETETQVVDTLPECESQEQDPANEQVCQEKPPSEINICCSSTRTAESGF